MQYLKEKAYPLMKGAAEFALEWLQQDNETDYLVTNPSTSPENKFKYTDSKRTTNNRRHFPKPSTMDMAMIWDLFSNCIEASKILNTDADFRKTLVDAREKLYPPHLGSKRSIAGMVQKTRGRALSIAIYRTCLLCIRARKYSPRMSPDLQPLLPNTDAQRRWREQDGR